MKPPAGSLPAVRVEDLAAIDQNVIARAQRHLR
jgi:hypothetical protein